MFTNEHRYFIQYMLKNSYIPLNEATKVYGKIKEGENYESYNLEQLIMQINMKISEQGLRIIQSKCDLTGEDKVILINTCSDNVTKLLGIFTPLELQYFQTIVKEILTSSEHRIPEGICLNLAKTEMVLLKTDHAEDVLNMWMKMGYLLHKGRYIYLGCRSIAELGPYFHEYFKDYIKSCGLCSEIVISGYICENCEENFHKTCMNKFLVKHKVCPNCKNNWKNDEPAVSDNKNTTEDDIGDDVSESDESDQ